MKLKVKWVCYRRLLQEEEFKMKSLTSSLLAMISFSFLFLPCNASGEVLSLPFQQNVTDMTPFFMEGHEGDTNYIAGFILESDLILGSTNVGTYTSQLTLQEQPMSFTSIFNDYTFSGTATFTGLGSCELNGYGVTMATNLEGDMIIDYVGRLSDCTDALAGIIALVDGKGEANILLTSGGSEFVLEIPLP